MKRLIEFYLEDGGSIVVEVDEPESAGGAGGAGGVRPVLGGGKRAS
jgi:hypothetical protein